MGNRDIRRSVEGRAMGGEHGVYKMDITGTFRWGIEDGHYTDFEEGKQGI